ncbi:uncharacterized protein LDX57_011506 [Aspergillus melleus]|uniref:uncharacterized protein n=1 Tax=Aspergillus melleus TaxID=138277 RepID=UPI001E8D3343|nr:uncharacterized protein LDX57_011506 [Aspergillus melleus]KAH8433870.1 hypothetical protein LDX57_011506 [Aspergillus melleus]
MAYKLSVEVFGDGENPNDPSHWGFTINKPPNPYGDLLHVRTLDAKGMFFQFEPRLRTRLNTQQALGLCVISTLTDQQRQRATQIVANEEAPKDGKRNCQDWVLSTLIALEIEELVAPGTAEFWKEMIGKPARYVRGAVGANWIALRKF